MEPCFLTAAEAASRIESGSLTCEELVRSCIARIEARDATIKAWLYIDKAHAIATARELDKRPRKSPLHGLPFGVKDMIDTKGVRTTFASYIYEHKVLAADSVSVARLKQAGAIPFFMTRLKPEKAIEQIRERFGQLDDNRIAEVLDVKHDNGTQTLYAHLSSVAVSVGSVVGKGDTLGGVGNTGKATGIHLHFEVRGAKNPFGG